MNIYKKKYQNNISKKIFKVHKLRNSNDKHIFTYYILGSDSVLMCVCLFICADAKRSYWSHHRCDFYCSRDDAEPSDAPLPPGMHLFIADTGEITAAGAALSHPSRGFAKFECVCMANCKVSGAQQLSLIESAKYTRSFKSQILTTMPDKS